MLGSGITIHNHGYVSTEGLRGKALNFGDSGEFIFDIEDVVEFIDATHEQTHDNIVQAVSICCPFVGYQYDISTHNSQWDLKPGKLYLPVYTCRDGLWRYLMEDVLEVVGFHPRNGLPVFKFSSRKKYAKW